MKGSISIRKGDYDKIYFIKSGFLTRVEFPD